LLTVIITTPTVLEPILVFAKSALHVRDSHSVNCIITTLRECVSLFRAPGPVLDFICDDILKAAITSLHDPYFVDLQKDLASLIVRIIMLDAEKSAAVIGSLPGLSDQPERVRTVLERVRSCLSERIGRAMVLELLEQIRGVSIHEMGRIGGPKKSKRRAALLEQYMAVDKNPAIERGGSPSLDGVANLLQ
jgi:exportin-5